MNLLKYLPLLLLFISCDKKRASKLAGQYSCIAKYGYYNMNGSAYDTTYYDTIEVIQNGKDLELLGYRVHIKEVWKTDGYESLDHYSKGLKVMFRNDSIYVSKTSGGLGGTSGVCRAGVKL